MLQSYTGSWMRTLSLGLVLLVLLVLLGAVGPAGALVVATDPDDGSVFFRLFRPTGKFDETGLAGFEFLLSSRTGEFRANDQYLIAGEVTQPNRALAADLGSGAQLSGRAFAFAIQHHLVGGRNFTFILTDLLSSARSVLCWGTRCAPGSLAAPTLGGQAPIRGYNGLQIQVRAQDVPGASAAVTLASLTGVPLGGAALFDEVVTPGVPGTIFAGDAGRRGQWLLGDALDLVQNEWELTGIVTLTRPDAALTDLTKVRLAVDLVRDPTLPFLVPEPSRRTLLLEAALLLLAASALSAGRPSARE